MRSGPALVAALVLLALAGCTPSAVHVPSSPSASATPVFASDADALKAAEVAYAAYLKVSDEIGQGGWVNTKPLKKVARSRVLDNDLKTAKAFESRGLIQRGQTRFDTISLQADERTVEGRAVVTVYLCLDVSDVDIVDASGVSAVSSSRPSRVPLEVNLDSFKSSALLVSRSDVWSGQNFC